MNLFASAFGVFADAFHRVASARREQAGEGESEREERGFMDRIHIVVLEFIVNLLPNVAPRDGV